VQRHVLKLIDAVGAKTRFQAALHIGHRLWATPPSAHEDSPKSYSSLMRKNDPVRGRSRAGSQERST
jgi:hypothetical protein